MYIYIVYGCNMSTGSMTCVAKLPVRRVTPADCSPTIRSSSVPNPKAETASNFAKLGVVSKVFFRIEIGPLTFLSFLNFINLKTSTAKSPFPPMTSPNSR